MNARQIVTIVVVSIMTATIILERILYLLSSKGDDEDKKKS